MLSARKPPQNSARKQPTIIYRDAESSSSSQEGSDIDDGNQRVLVRVDKNAEEPSNFTWTELVSEADFVFKRDGQSPQGIIHFLKALSKFDRVPDSCSPEEMQQFSILF